MLHFPHPQQLKRNRKRWFPPSIPHYFCFPLLLSPPPFFLGILFAAGLITGCHKCSVFSQKVLVAPSRATGLPGGWQAGGKMTIALEANRETHNSGETPREEQKDGEELCLSRLFHLCFDWTVIVICGPHCISVKGSGINKWCNYETLMWHKRRDAGQEKASGWLSASVIRLTCFCSICVARLTGI